MATEVGTAVVKLTFDGKDLTGSLQKTGAQLQATGKGLGSRWGHAWAVAAGNLISDAIKKLANVVTSNMNDAISRLDTLNNFPKVMQSLGYSAEESSSSIEMMSDKLDGLPTSLDAMAGDVQKLAATMGNLNKGMVNATTVGLGLNNMFLAGGKGTQAASAAMEQYNQMLAMGKVDMQSWNSLVNAAPGQMDQLSKSLLGANANQQTLYKAMQDGTVSFDQLNAKIVELNEKGGANFASFEDQAVSATGGIATQLQNISTTVTKIIAAAMEGNNDAVEKGIKQLTGRIGNVAPTLVKGFSNGFVALAKALPAIINNLAPTLLEGLQVMLNGISDTLPDIVTSLLPAIMNALNVILMWFLGPGVTSIINTFIQSIPILMNGLMTLLQSLVQAIPTILPQIMSAITTLVTQLAIFLTDPGFLTMMLEAALTLFVTLVESLPQIIDQLLAALPTVIDNIIKFLTSPKTITMILNAAVKLFLALVLAVPKIVGRLIGAFGTLVGNLWNGITRMFGEFAGRFGNFIGDIFKGAVNGVLQFIENIINGPIDIINGFIGGINDAFGGIGVHLDTIERVSLPRLAEGGVVNAMTIAMIGEDGDEAVLPLENNTDNWAGTLASILTEQMNEQDELEGRTINVTMNNNIDNKLDAQEIGRVMIESIRRAA